MAIIANTLLATTTAIGVLSHELWSSSIHLGHQNANPRFAPTKWLLGNGNSCEKICVCGEARDLHGIPFGIEVIPHLHHQFIQFRNV